MIVKRAVIPAAGLGTRLLPATKETPKEMLPIFVKYKGRVILKPLLQVIFEELYSKGIKEFCFIVGRGKRAIEDHFTPDGSFLSELRRRGKDLMANMLEEFYEKIRSSRIVWVNQPEPKGFGDAIACAEPFVGGEPFVVHAGDTLIFSDDYYERLIEVFTREEVAVCFLVKEVEDPRMYGVVIPKNEMGDVIDVKGVIEKPREPPSNIAIMPVYIFDPIILRALKVVKPSFRGEVELTDAIQKVINWGFKVKAVKLRKDEDRIDIGTPETYWEALKISFVRAKHS